MTTTIRTGTATTTNTSAVHIINLMMNVTRDVSALEHAWPQVAMRQVQAALTDVTQLLLEGIADVVFVVFHTDGAVLRSYKYSLFTEVEAWGPPAGEPPIGELPPGTRATIALERSVSCPVELFREWMARLGWQTCPMKMPGTAEYEHYGAFTSGPYGLERALYCSNQSPSAKETKKP